MAKPLLIHVPKIVLWLGCHRFWNLHCWFAKTCGIQCSGKYKWGHAKIWCQQTAGHLGPCTDYNGEEFQTWHSTSQAS